MKTKRLLSFAVATTMLLSLLNIGAFANEVKTGALSIKSPDPITVGTETVDVDFTLTFDEETKSPHSLCTIVTDLELKALAVKTVDGEVPPTYNGSEGEPDDGLVTVDTVTISNDGADLANKKVVFESGVDSNAPVVTEIVFTATFNTADKAEGTYTVGATVDATNYDENDFNITVGEDAVVTIEEAVVEPECEHANAVEELTTATTEKLAFAYTCPDCGEVYTIEHDVTNITSSTFKFTHTLNVESDITLNFKFKKANLTNYTDTFAVFDKARFGETEFTGYDRTIMKPEQDPNASANYIFPFTGVAAKEMNSDIIATLYAKDANGNYVCATETYGVVAYVKQILAQPTSTTYPANLKIALVDMVNYGSKAQLHFKYNKNSLGSDEIANYQDEFASELREEFTDSRTTSSFDESLVTSWAQTLDLENKVVVNIRMVAPETLNINNYVLKVTYTTTSGVETTLEVPGNSEEIVWKNSRWVYAFDSLTAIQFTETFTAALYDLEGKQVSSVWTSGVESYAAAVIAQPTNATYTENLKTMLKYMMTYGDSVSYYFKNR